MSNSHPNQKYVDKILTQLKAFMKKFDTTVPGVLKEFKRSFSKMPGDMSKLYNSVQGLIKHVHQEREVIMQAVHSNKFYYIPINAKHIAEELWHVDAEVEKLSNKYKDNSPLQSAVRHFHELNAALKKVLSAIVNATLNLINKSDRIPESKYRDHTLGIKVNEDRILKKAKGGAF